jgi:hypothetical protein
VGQKLINMKLILRGIMLMAMILITSYALAYDIQVDGVYYNVNASERTCEVTHNGDNTYSGDIIIPETLNYKNKTLIVSSIGYKAFYNRYNINRNLRSEKKCFFI